jgi:prepilin-type N-terminal cleavage/methylation domain-containing protein
VRDAPRVAIDDPSEPRSMPAAVTQRRAAFSLLELLLALALASILLGMTALAWPRVEAAVQLDAGLQQLAADLHAAQTLAIASASQVRLVFTPGTDRYRRERADDRGTYRYDLERRLPRGIRITDVNSGGDLTFTARGQGENGTVTLGDRRGTRRSLRLNQRGRVTLLPVAP